jgi:aminotransferase
MTETVGEQKKRASQRTRGMGLSGIRAIFERAQAIPDVIRLEFGEPDFDTPENIKLAAIRAIEQGKTKYSSSAGILELREAISDKLSRENKIDYDPKKEIVVTNGATAAIYNALLSTVDQGDEVLIPNPGWATYAHSVKISGATPVGYSLRPESGFSFERENVQKLVSPRTRAILINTPSNPIGSVLSRRQINEIAEFAVENDLFVISDEVYEKFVYADDSRKIEPHFSIASMEGMKERTVTVNSMSKTYAMTGWRIGYAAASEEVAQAMTRANAAANSCISTVAQYASVEALTGSQDSVLKMITEFRRRRDMLVRLLNELDGFSCRMPEGAFYVFPKISGFGMNSSEFAMYILETAHVALIPGSAFGSEGEGHLRIAYANSFEKIEEAVERIRKNALAQLTGDARRR